VREGGEAEKGGIENGAAAAGQWVRGAPPIYAGDRKAITKTRLTTYRAKRANLLTTKGSTKQKLKC